MYKPEKNAEIAFSYHNPEDEKDKYGQKCLQIRKKNKKTTKKLNVRQVYFFIHLMVSVSYFISGKIHVTDQ